MIDFYGDLLDELREIATLDTSEYSEQIKITAPGWMKAAVKRGFKLRDASKDKCCTAVGLRRGNQILNGETLSLSTIKRMKSFAARHGSNADFQNNTGKQAQALLLWGVPHSPEGVKKFIKWCDAKISQLES